jgi:hypothetical protein
MLKSVAVEGSVDTHVKLDKCLTLDKARWSIGRIVVYSVTYAKPKFGVITSVSEDMIFVRFDKDMYAKGCRPGDLILATIWLGQE